ncbi:MAG: M1 family aminopeptidase, partial [Pseudomonadota bacterium]
MRPRSLFCLAAVLPLLWAASGGAWAAEETARFRVAAHDLRLSIGPEDHSLKGQDRLILSRPVPARGGEILLLLHQGLDITRVTPGTAAKAKQGAWGEAAGWVVSLPAGVREVLVEYGGLIYDPPRRGQRAGLATETSGIISSEGLFLPHAYGFMPWEPGGRARVSASVDTEKGFEVVSTGRLAARQLEGRRAACLWETDGTDDSFLIGGPLKMHEDSAAGGRFYIYLYKEDAGLAPAYAARLKQLLPFYVGLLGKYPYEKFAVVENFFPTGYGFPSLTLLGKQVVRLPFVLEGSLAHEFVHSWWGNSVRPKDSNWVEGLTAYLSDYLLVERKGPDEARAERRLMLERYSAYAGRIEESLASFTEPGDRLNDALGYTKGALVFHQLRQWLGDEAFFEGLRIVAGRHRDGSASWADLRAAFEESSGKDLKWFFTQWVEWPG